MNLAGERNFMPFGGEWIGYGKPLALGDSIHLRLELHYAVCVGVNAIENDHKRQRSAIERSARWRE